MDRSGRMADDLNAIGGSTLRRRQFRFPYAGSGQVAIPPSDDRGRCHGGAPRSAAKTWRRGGGRPPLDPEGAINSLLTRFTQRHRKGARVTARPGCKRRRSRALMRNDFHIIPDTDDERRAGSVLARIYHDIGLAAVAEALRLPLGQFRAGDDRVARTGRVLSASASPRACANRDGRVRPAGRDGRPTRA